MLCFSGFELYSRWVPLENETAQVHPCKNGIVIVFSSGGFFFFFLDEKIDNITPFPLLELNKC